MNDTIKYGFFVAALVLGGISFVRFVMWEGDRAEHRAAMQAQTAAAAEHDRRFGPCVETATLLATTTGSPDTVNCPNVRHKMRVVPATVPSGEEAAATVFCECVAVDGGAR